MGNVDSEEEKEGKEAACMYFPGREARVWMCVRVWELGRSRQVSPQFQCRQAKLTQPPPGGPIRDGLYITAESLTIYFYGFEVCVSQDVHVCESPFGFWALSERGCF